MLLLLVLRLLGLLLSIVQNDVWPRGKHSCPKVAVICSCRWALQLLGAFLTDISLLICEAGQRRTFLKKNVAKLGPGGAAWAASWPLGDVRGAQRCILLAFAYLASLCLVWQVLLIFFV